MPLVRLPVGKPAAMPFLIRRVEFVTRRFYRHDVKMNSQAANECACAK
jgi:hypothetical protein